MNDGLCSKRAMNTNILPANSGPVVCSNHSLPKEDCNASKSLFIEPKLTKPTSLSVLLLKTSPLFTFISSIKLQRWSRIKLLLPYIHWNLYYSENLTQAIYCHTTILEVLLKHYFYSIFYYILTIKVTFVSNIITCTSNQTTRTSQK